MPEKTVNNNSEKDKVPRQVYALGFVSMLNDSASEMVSPLLPVFITQVLGATSVAVGIIEGIAESTSSLIKLVSGVLSDMWRRRKPLVFLGYAFAVLSRPLIGITHAWQQVLGLRFIDRVGKGIRTAPRDALISLSTPRSVIGKAFGIHRALDHTGAILGPLLATALLWILSDNLRGVFLFAIVPGLFALFVLTYFVKEPNYGQIQGEKEKTQIEYSAWYKLSPNFRAYLITLFIFTLGNASDAFIILRARQLNIDVRWIPALWMVFNLVKMFSSVPAGIISDKFHRRGTVVLGWSVYSIAYLGFALNKSALLFVFNFAFYGLFYGITEGVERALVTDLVRNEHQGTAFGWYHLVIGLGALPASVIFGVIWRTMGSVISFLLGCVLAFISSFLLLTWVRE